jgi:hypothetical protein
VSLVPARKPKGRGLLAAAVLVAVSVSLTPTAAGIVRWATDKPCSASDGAGVYLYAGTNYTGACSFFGFNSGTPIVRFAQGLDRSVVGDNTASSIRITGNDRVTLFLHHGFDGTSTTFVGDDPDFSDDAIGQDSASSIAVEIRSGVCNRGEGVWLFERTNCHGRATGVFGSNPEDVPELASTNVGDNDVSSLALGGQRSVTLYHESGFRGSSSTFRALDTNLSDNGVGDNAASSARFRVSGCDDLAGVYVYADSAFGGRCSKFNVDVPDLGVEYIGNDTASSLRTIGDFVADAYVDRFYQGPSTRFWREDKTFGDNSPIGHDTASSMQIRPRTTLCDGELGVYLYAEANYRGRCWRFTDEMRDLGESYVGDNAASSIRIFGTYSASLYADRSLAGTSSTFTGDDPDLANTAVGSGRASSIAIEGPVPEREFIHRIQLRVVVGNVTDAGTDDDVVVSLNPKNATWLDYARNDFERGSTFTYDLLTDGVARFDDIDWIAFAKTGTDGVCIARVDLIVNNSRQPSYSRSFFPCRSLDDENGHTRDLALRYDDLRRSPAWRQYTPPNVVDQLILRADEVQSRIESLVGHFLHFSPGYWGKFYGAPVELERSDSHTIHVDLDLAGEADGPDPEVDVDFDINATCNSEHDILIRVLNAHANAHFPLYAKLLSLGILEFIEQDLQGQINKALTTFAEDRTIPIGGRCGEIYVNPSGDIVLLPRLTG